MMIDARFDVRTAFSSERLNYTALDAKDEETASFFYEHVFNDPEMSFHSSNYILNPEDRASVNKFVESMATGLISVVVRLKPEKESEQGNRESDYKQHSFPRNRGRMIGFAFLTSSGVPQHRSSGLGVSIVKQFQGQGYGSEAIDWILDAGFRRANLHSITLSVFSFNPAFKLYERLGFKVDGRRRDAIWFDGKWHDTIIMSILEDEWREIRGLH